jgi:hypothetical protein
MALPDFLSDIIKFIIFLVLLSIVGWVITESGVLGNYPPINASFVYQVQVLDHNGSPVPDQKVYFLSCLQEPAGWFTPTRYANSSGTYGYTDKNGMVELDSINYTVHKNEIVWLGASKNETLLESDYNNKTFNPGSIGEWTHHEYHNVSVSGNMGLSTIWASVILIRNSDGKMIDVNQYGDEHGFNDLNTHAIVRFVDYLNYIDNQTL